MMKSHVNEHHVELDTGDPFENEIRSAVLEARESVAAEHLDRLIKSKPDRCLDVIRAGGLIPY